MRTARGLSVAWLATALTGAVAGAALGIAAVTLWAREWGVIEHFHGPRPVGGLGSTAIDNGTMTMLHVDGENALISGKLSGAAYAAGSLMVLAALLALATIVRLVPRRAQPVG